MAKLYEMCNDIDSEELLEERVELTKKEKEKLRKTIKKLPKKKRNSIAYIGGVFAAAAAALILVLNTSAQAAYAMGNMPVVGVFFRAITVREYQYSTDHYEADISQPEIVVNNVNKAEVTTETEEKTKESVDTINESIDEMTNRLIAEFEKQSDESEGYGAVYTDHKVVTNTDKWFTLQITVCSVAGSANEYQYYYHIDKQTGEIATLKDLFKDNADYVSVISEDILRQMKEQMTADEGTVYFISEDDKEMGWAFEAIKPDQNFYLNDDGNIVICFDECEVAPACMGLVEFEIEKDTVADLLK